MHLGELKSNTLRKSQKRVGRGGKRGTFSGHGSKGQKSRAGAGVKPGFRGGDNRIWQLFPKKRGASKKPGNKKPHRKHRFFQLRHAKPAVINLDLLNKMPEGELDPIALKNSGLVENISSGVKILGNGEVTKKFALKGFELSESAKQKIIHVGGQIIAKNE